MPFPNFETVEEVVSPDVNFGVLQRPFLVLDFRAIEVAFGALAIQAVPFSGPYLERFLSEIFMGMRFVASLKAVISDFAGVVNGVPLLLHVDFAVPVGQVKKGSSGPNRELRGNVETEKPHSWLTVAGDVGTNVDFREVGNGIECRAVP